MMLPLLPPRDHYQISRDLWDGPGYRRKTRHVSFLDLHELGGDHDALRPDAVRMAIHRTLVWIAHIPIMRRVQQQASRGSQLEKIQSEPNPSPCQPATFRHSETRVPS